MQSKNTFTHGFKPNGRSSPIITISVRGLLFIVEAGWGNLYMCVVAVIVVCLFVV